NVGHTVKMDQLRRLFEEMGLARVETFIASGNVIFDSTSRNARSLETKIESHLKKALGYTVATFIRSMPELADIARHNPFEAQLSAGGKSLFVGFLGTPPAPASKQKLWSPRSKINSFPIHQPPLYLP